MASQKQIFGILAGASAPVGRTEMAEKIGEPYKNFQTQLDRYAKAGLIEDTGDHYYQMTDEGRKVALAEEKGSVFPGRELPGELRDDVPPTHETTGTTEYQQFYKLGVFVGVIPMSLIAVMTETVFGGDYQDLNWVAKCLQSMGIQKDLANRWLHGWGSHLKSPLPKDLAEMFLPGDTHKSEEGEAEKRREGVGKRDYIISAENLPVYMGLYKGDLDYADAYDLAKLRTAKDKRDGHPDTVGTLADEVSKIFLAFKSMMGPQVAGKSYIVNPSEEGYQVNEVDPNKPFIIPQTAANKASSTFYVDSDGKTQELQPGQPLVIVKESPKPAATGTQYLIDQRSGEYKEVIPGQPIIIKAENPPAAQATPLQMKDKDGNDIVLDINTYIRLEEHRDKAKRDDESHETKMEIARGFKDLLKHAEKALIHVGEQEE